MKNIGDERISKHAGRDDLAGEYKYGDLGQILLFVLFAGALLLDLLWLQLFPSWRHAVPLAVRTLLSVPFFVCAVILFRFSHRVIFDTRRERLTVVDSGVYHLVRHPMYLGALLLYLGILVLSLSVLALVVGLATLAFYFYIARFEEQILVERLGDSYLQYRARVPMFVPRLRKSS